MKHAPKLPTSLWSPLGPVKVVIVEHLRPLSKDAPDDIDDFGSFEPKTRTIEILKDLDPWAQWQALRHEWMHMVIFDAGYHNTLSPELQEGLCDLVGTAMAADMRNA